MNVAAIRGTIPIVNLPELTPVQGPLSSGQSAPIKPAMPISEPSSASASATVKRAYPAPAETPTQQGPNGLKFDFNDGCRVIFSEGEHPWRVRLSDLDTGNILFETEIKAGLSIAASAISCASASRSGKTGQTALTHDYSAAEREVLIQFPVGTLGDTMSDGFPTR